MEQLTQQRMESLMLANQTRFTKAEDKRRIKKGEVSAAELLRHPPEHWKKATVLELLTAMHRVGPSRARSWLWMERIDAGMTIGQMPEMTRFRLARHLDAAVRRAAARAS
jgi:hypothetical protein